MRSFVCLLAGFVFFCVYPYTAGDVEGYVEAYRGAALENEKAYGIPAPIILAQGILESGAGTSGLTRASNNHFGIKAGRNWTGPVYMAWDDESTKSRFRSYSSAGESYRDHARLLTTASCYRSLFSISVYDYRGWAYGLKKAGYATAPLYAQALIGIIDRYRLYEINGGVKLKPGKTVTITRYIEAEKPEISGESVLEDQVETEEQIMMDEAMARFAVEINNVQCTVLQPGETLASISRKHDISSADLLEYNEIATEYQAREGDIVFLARKKKKYEGAQDVYIAKQGETLHDISQEFGIRLHHLAKMNGLDDYETIEAGMRIILK